MVLPLWRVWPGKILGRCGSPRLDSGQDPSWQPVIYAMNLLIPVVNLGQDGLWRTSGASAWVAGTLTAIGWLLLTTAAAGVTRILTRR